MESNRWFTRLKPGTSHLIGHPWFLGLVFAVARIAWWLRWHRQLNKHESPPCQPCVCRVKSDKSCCERRTKLSSLGISPRHMDCHALTQLKAVGECSEKLESICIQVGAWKGRSNSASYSWISPRGAADADIGDNYRGSPCAISFDHAYWSRLVTSGTKSPVEIQQEKFGAGDPFFPCTTSVMSVFENLAYRNDWYSTANRPLVHLMSTQVGLFEETTGYVFLDGMHASWCSEKCMAHRAELVNIRDEQKQK